MGANYEDVLKRLYNEGMICRFTLMFLNDDSYPKLEQALKEGNVKEAFRAAHTLKGVCQNLGFTNLYQPTYDLTEWPMGTDCKSAAFSFGGSNPPAPTKKPQRMKVR